jgi:hypothetical protein
MERAEQSMLSPNRADARFAGMAVHHLDSPPRAAVPGLIERWVPALPRVDARLREGAMGAELECGWGAGTIALAQAYPNSHFFGFDRDPGVLRRAQARAEEEDLSERTTFEAAAPEAMPNHRYSLVVLVSGLRRLPCAVDVARRVLATLDPEGSFLMVEPNPTAGETATVRRPANAHRLPIPSWRAGTWTAPVCGTSERTRDLGGVLADAGFAQVRLVDRTPFECVFEARR